MRKSRLVPISAILLIIALCAWGWLERDRAVPVLANLLIDGGRIESLDGLKIAVGEIDIERLQFSLDSGATLHLGKVHLLRPSSLIFAGDQNRTQITVEQLSFTPAETEVVSPSAQERARIETKSPFKLSDTLAILHRYLPEKLNIRELYRQGEEARSGSIDLHRDYNRNTIDVDLSSGEQQLSLRIQPQVDHLALTAHLGTTGQSPALSMDANLTLADADTWRTTLQLEADLQRITSLPLSRNLSDIAASASGKLMASLALELPDDALQLRAYRDITAKLRSESVDLTLPKALLGFPADLSLSTDPPIELSITSLQPVSAKEIAGSAIVKVTPKDQSVPLLDLRAEAGSAAQGPSIDVVGTFNLKAAAPLLTVPRWQKLLDPIELDSPSGILQFNGTAQVKPLRDVQDLQHSWLGGINFTLLPDSHAGFNFKAELQKDSLAAQLGWQKGAADVKIVKALNLEIAEWPGDILISDGSATLELTSGGRGTDIKSQLQQIDCTIAEETRCSLNLTLATDKVVHDAGTLSIIEPEIDTLIDFSLHTNRQRWQLRQVEFSAQELSRDGIEIENLSLGAPQVECTLTDDNPDCTSPELTASFSKLAGEEMTATGAIRFEEFRFRRDDSQPQFSSGYRSDNLKLTAQGRYRLEPLLTGKLSVHENKLRGESQVQLGSLKARAQWHHDLDTAKGNTEFSVDSTEFSQQQPLSELVQGLPLDFVAGTLSATGKVSWPQAQHDTVSVALNDIAAVYGDSFATGLRAQLALVRPKEQWITAEPRPVHIDTLDVGLPVKDIQFTLSLDEQQDLKLGEVEAELLGGKLKSDAVVWNLTGEERRSLVLLSDISLRELARETEAENFAASGVLDLRIPLITGAEGVTVEQGTVRARAPGGRLRYYGAFSPEMLSGNPQLKLIAGALEDYSYRELSGTLEYPPSGDMQLQLKLVGRSESVDAERDLIINLNLENNIPAMLRSLQASRDLTEALEKHIQ